MIDIPLDKYPVAAYQKINLAAATNFVIGVLSIIFYVGCTLDTMHADYFIFFLIFGIWMIFTALMLKKSERLLLSGEVEKVRKGGKIALIFGIIGFNWWAFVGGIDAMDWKATYSVGNYDYSAEEDLEAREFMVRRL